MEYRKVGPGDIDALVRIRERTDWGGEDSRPRTAAYLAGTHHPQKALAPRVIYLAEDDGEAIGFIAGHLTRRYDCDGELQWIVVVPDRWGAGVADGLLERLASWFVEEGARRVCVDVSPSNEAARRFYRRHGAIDLNPHWLVWPDIGVALAGDEGGSEAD